MYIKLLSLELKHFLRNPQFGVNLVMKLLMAFTYFWIGAMFVGMAFGLYFIAKEEGGQDPLRIFSKYFLYYAVLDLVVRYLLQQMPTQNIKPFLAQNISKKQLVNYTVLRIFLHFFNWGYLLFMLPFCALLIFHGGYSVPGVLMFLLGIMAVFYFNNFLNILLNKKNAVLFAVAALVIALGALDYYGFVPFSSYSEAFFYSFYEIPGAFLITVVLAAVVSNLCYRAILGNFYLDKGLELEKAEGKTEDIKYLRRFGTIGTFINNDIRLLKRSKADKVTMYMSIAFLFYGLLFFNDMYQSDFMKLFAAIFVTGGFMMMFGQRVPAWDSSYYPLMMTQQVPYKKFLMAKWSLIILSIFIGMILSTAYLYFGWETYLTILGAGLYNLGVNSYLTLLAGAYNKQAIDLNSTAKSFGGGKNSFNMKVLLIAIPQMVLPMAVFATVKYFIGMYAAVAALGLLGAAGFMLRNYIFDFIVNVYKTQKYSTLEAFKKEN